MILAGYLMIQDNIPPVFSLYLAYNEDSDKVINRTPSVKKTYSVTSLLRTPRRGVLLLKGNNCFETEVCY
jgi:hypothetical protein